MFYMIIINDVYAGAVACTNEKLF